MIEYHFTKLDYSDRAGCPLFGAVIFGIVLALVILIKMFVEIYRKRCSFSAMSISKKFHLFIPLVSVVLVLGITFFNYWPTLKYSRYLPFESEENSVMLSGQIELISPVLNSPNYTIGDEKISYFASIVKIDGKEFYFLTAEGLSTGMRVEINYLPQSHMVLDCAQLE